MKDTSLQIHLPMDFIVNAFYKENESKEGLWVMVAMRARKDIHIPEVKLFIPV